MKKKIAIIGCGNMGGAIAASLPLDKYNVIGAVASEASAERLKEEILGVGFTTDNAWAAMDADIVVLAVKPYIVDGVIEEIRSLLKPEALVLSVVAGRSIESLRQQLDADNRSLTVMRVIPNTAIRLGKSVTFIAHGKAASKADVDEAVGIFNLSGTAFVIPEKDMAACTALASCGIAYFLRFIRAAAEGSVELGLRPGFATKVAALTAEGAAALLADGAHPEVEIDKVTTPGGITIKGLNAREENGFTAAVIAALRASV
ncbi:MAG: NAD(P)-binding domain-containing protein [Muribaculaceae bacterium]|nr:NAD(P)-binding domain-containing protein [Muribaculaceae bacterium]